MHGAVVSDELEALRVEVQKQYARLDEHVQLMSDKHGAKPMTTDSYTKWLNSSGLLTGGRKAVKQDVFHIIASSNGGADHPHNYLYTLGKEFNIQISDKLDELNCYLAGVPLAAKAIGISMAIENTPRSKKPPRSYVCNFHEDPFKEAEAMCKDGKALVDLLMKVKSGQIEKVPGPYGAYMRLVIPADGGKKAKKAKK